MTKGRISQGALLTVGRLDASVIFARVSQGALMVIARKSKDSPPPIAPRNRTALVCFNVAGHIVGDGPVIEDPGGNDPGGSEERSGYGYNYGKFYGGSTS